MELIGDKIYLVITHKDGSTDLKVTPVAEDLTLNVLYTGPATITRESPYLVRIKIADFEVADFGKNTIRIANGIIPSHGFMDVLHSMKSTFSETYDWSNS